MSTFFVYLYVWTGMGFLCGAVVKNLLANTGDTRDVGLISESGRSFGVGNGKWKPTPVFLTGKFHRQRSMVGYSPWGCKESDMTEAT